MPQCKYVKMATSKYQTSFKTDPWPTPSDSKALLTQASLSINMGAACVSWRKFPNNLNLLGYYKGASQVVLVVKSMPANAGEVRDAGLILGLGRSPGGENGNPLQYSCLENQWTEESGGLQSTGSQSWMWLKRPSMHAPKYPHPDPQNLRIHHLPWQTVSRVSDRIEVANHLTLRWGNYPGWSRWAQYNHRNPSAWRGKKWVKERGTTTEAGSERCCYWLRKWRSYKPKWNASGLEKQEKPRKWILPKNLQKGMWPCQTLNFSPGRQVSDF